MEGDGKEKRKKGRKKKRKENKSGEENNTFVDLFWLTETENGKEMEKSCYFWVEERKKNTKKR